jgi:hypothetical protein
VTVHVRNGGPIEVKGYFSYFLVREGVAEAATKFDCTKTYYVELALRNQFQQDGIKL